MRKHEKEWKHQKKLENQQNKNKVERNSGQKSIKQKKSIANIKKQENVVYKQIVQTFCVVLTRLMKKKYRLKKIKVLIQRRIKIHYETYVLINFGSLKWIHFLQKNLKNQRIINRNLQLTWTCLAHDTILFFY